MNSHSTIDPKFEADLQRFLALDRQGRMAALAIVAHDLTVDVRVALLDLPSPEAVERLRVLNEFLHQITGRIHASDEHSARGESELLRDIAQEAEEKGLKGVVVRRLDAAVRHSTRTPKRSAAIGSRVAR